MSMKNLIVPEPYKGTPESIKNQKRSAWSNAVTDLEKVFLLSRRFDEIQIVFSYVAAIRDHGKGLESAILRSFSCSALLNVNGRILRGSSKHDWLVSHCIAQGVPLLHSCDPEAAEAACKMNLKTFFEVLDNFEAAGWPKNYLMLGVFATTPQNIEVLEDWQIARALDQFITSYFEKNVDKFPFGDFNELVLLGSL